MKRILRMAACVLSAGMLLGSTAGADSPAIPVSLREGLCIRNMGQYGPEILYYADLNCGRLYIRQNDLVVQLIEAGNPTYLKDPRPAGRRVFIDDDPMESPGRLPRRFVNLYFQFPSADFSHVVGERDAGTRLHIFRGNDPARWRTDIPTARQVRIRDIHPGLDLVVAPEGPDAPLWRFEAIRPGSPSGSPPMEVRAETGWSIELEGLRVQTPFGGFLLITGEQTVGLDPSRPGCSQPALPVTEIAGSGGRLPSATQQLRWGTFVGGSSYDDAYRLAIDPWGNVIFAGITGSGNIPAPNGFDGSINGDEDFYVGKLSADGSQLLWATYLGGNYEDHLNSLALGLQGEIIVCGKTTSENMPVQSGYDMSYNGTGDCYVAALSSAGSQLLFGTFLGGGSSEWPYAMAVAADGSIVIGGQTSSTDIPTPGGYDTSLNGYTNMYVAALSASGDQVLWGTYLGGSATDECYALALDSGGNVVVGGTTSSSNIPTPGGYDHSLSALYDMYVAKLSADGSDLLWGTFIGGSMSESAHELALDPQGNVIVCGESSSADMPVPGGFDTSMNGINDFYLTKLSSSGDQLLWGTYVGGSAYDWGLAVALNPDGRVVVGGYVNSADVSVGGGYDSSHNGGKDYFIAELSPGETNGSGGRIWAERARTTSITCP